ncbi:hypothetical protein ANN_14799 [Periplaneta americana]|uniref:Uncharacterized protein n=1 Tax=Periplaneta americana TaxID=6978 RepID=A0ABQ8SYI1_PERAM|nr:hypothetical protein ANN_14799 [Periplaneta americana]
MGNACYYSVEKLLSSSLLSKNLKVRIYKAVILPVLLYGCETWTLTLREEHRFRVFENKVLRKIFGAKRDEVTGEWRKLHNTELHALYSSPDVIRNIKSRRLRWAGHVARMGESRNAYRVLVGRPEGKRPLGRPRRRWEDNIKMDLREVGHDDRDWINLAQDRDRWRAYVRAAMNLRVFGNSPSSDMMEKFRDILSFCKQVSRLMVSEMRRRASNQSTEAASCAIVKFLEIENSEESSNGWMLLSALNLLAAGDVSLVEVMTSVSVPSTLVKCLYLFFDLPEIENPDTAENGSEFTPRERRILLQKIFVQVLVRLCSHEAPAEELAHKDDLTLLFSAITSWCPPHNVMWRKSAAEVLMTLSRHGLTQNVVGYIHISGICTKWKYKNWRFILRRGGKIQISWSNSNKYNDTQEEIKCRINMGNACYYSVEKLLSSSLLSKNLKVRIYKTVILPVLMYGCETWTLTLREEHRLRVFENKVFRKIFGAKQDEVIGEWRKLHNTELHALYSSPDIIRKIKSRRLRWAGHVARMGESRNAYRVLIGRLEGKRPLGRPRRRLEDNIKMDLREVGYDDRDWINLAQDRDRWRAYVRAAMNLWKGCVALCIENMQRVQELSPLEIVEMFVAVFCFLKDSSEVAQTLLDDFRTCQGYLFLSEFLLKLEHDSSAESQEAIRNLVLMVASLTMCGYKELQPSHASMGSLFQMMGFTLPQPSGRGASVRNIQAFQVLQSVFLKSNSAALCCTILDAISSVYHSDNANYFILEGQNTLSQFAEKIHLKPQEIQEKFFQLLEFIVFQLNFVPCKELISLSILLKGQTSVSCSITCMQTLLNILRHNTIFKDVYREVGILEVFVTCLHRYAALLKEKKQAQDQGREYEIPPLNEMLGMLVMEALTLLLNGNSNNASVFRESGGARCAHNLVPYPECRQQVLGE